MPSRPSMGEETDASEADYSPDPGGFDRLPADRDVLHSGDGAMVCDCDGDVHHPVGRCHGAWCGQPHHAQPLEDLQQKTRLGYGAITLLAFFITLVVGIFKIGAYRP